MLAMKMVSRMCTVRIKDNMHPCLKVNNSNNILVLGQSACGTAFILGPCVK